MTLEVKWRRRSLLAPTARGWRYTPEGWDRMIAVDSNVLIYSIGAACGRNRVKKRIGVVIAFDPNVLSRFLRPADPLPQRVPHHLRSVVQAELVEDVADVELDGVLAQVEAVGEFAV